VQVFVEVSVYRFAHLHYDIEVSNMTQMIKYPNNWTNINTKLLSKSIARTLGPAQPTKPSMGHGHGKQCCLQLKLVNLSVGECWSVHRGL